MPIQWNIPLIMWEWNQSSRNVDVYWRICLRKNKMESNVFYGTPFIAQRKIVAERCVHITTELNTMEQIIH